MQTVLLHKAHSGLKPSQRDSQTGVALGHTKVPEDKTHLKTTSEIQESSKMATLQMGWEACKTQVKLNARSVECRAPRWNLSALHGLLREMLIAA